MLIIVINVLFVLVTLLSTTHFFISVESVPIKPLLISINFLCTSHLFLQLNRTVVHSLSFIINTIVVIRVIRLIFIFIFFISHSNPVFPLLNITRFLLGHCMIRRCPLPGTCEKLADVWDYFVRAVVFLWDFLETVLPAFSSMAYFVRHCWSNVSASCTLIVWYLRPSRRVLVVVATVKCVSRSACASAGVPLP